ncbi:hypothetical protein BJY04DRAFT_70752 [Aspergillus karnatakaensis]|uniref:uncharacterized protein n=1 Tax=Aspergillus karnatakaensis TaxID=1810916 RepID=UPI003CCDA6C9
MVFVFPVLPFPTFFIFPLFLFDVILFSLTWSKSDHHSSTAALLHSPFPLDGPITTDGDYSGGQRSYPGPTGFSMDDDDSHRRSSAVGGHLAQSVPIPATNGLRYNAQQSAMQDNPYGNPSLLLSPSDSISGLFCFTLDPHLSQVSCNVG